MSTLPPAAIQELQLGNKIAAIKQTRIATRMGLKDAKELVEAYIATSPAMQAQLQSAQANNRGSFLGWLVMIVLVIAAVIYFWPP